MSDDIFDDITAFLREPKEPETALLDDKQIETLIMSLANGRQQEGFTEDEVANLLIWAQQAIINQSLLNLILKGLVFVSTSNNELLKSDGSNMTVNLSDIGHVEFRKLDN